MVLACTCDQCGSVSCDRDLGSCQCQRNVEGLNCDRCKVSQWMVNQKSLRNHCMYIWISSGELILPKFFLQPDTYGFDSCAGCRDCNCGLASVSTQCDSITGQCTCMPGTEGNYCDQCSEGFWNYTAAGCQGNHLENQESEAKRCFTEWEMNTETYTCLILTLTVCECEEDGAITCDRVTGRCQCLPGVTGDRCDRCLPRYILVPNKGCQGQFMK